MALFEHRRRLTWLELFIALALGGLAASLSSFVLFGMKKFYFVLVTGALATLVGCMITPDLGRYWLAILLLSIPIKIGKIFAKSEYVQQYVSDHGFPPGALPVFNIILTDIPFYLLLLVAIVNVMRQRTWPRAHPVVWMAFGAVAWAGLSLYNAKLLDCGGWELYRLTQYVFFSIVAMWVIRDRDDLKVIFWVSAGMLAFQGIYCVGQFFWDLNSILFPSDVTTYSSQGYSGSAAGAAGEGGALGGHRRGGGTIGHANVTAQYFEFWLPWVVAAAFAARSYGARLAMWLAAFCTLVGLVFTFSRGGAIAIAVGLVATVFALARGGFLTRRFTWGIVAMIFLGLVAAAPGLYYYMTTRPEMFEDRFWLLKVAWAMATDHPWLGVGLNQSMAVFNDYDYKHTGTPERIHLYYFALMAERGFPGFLLFAIFYLTAWGTAWRYAKRSPDPLARMGSAAAFGALSAALVHMSFDLFFGMPTQWSIYLNAGFAIACARLAPSYQEDLLAEAAPFEPEPDRGRPPPQRGPLPNPAFARST
jgi:O-antigen ligase